MGARERVCAGEVMLWVRGGMAGKMRGGGCLFWGGLLLSEVDPK